MLFHDLSQSTAILTNSNFLIDIKKTIIAQSMEAITTLIGLIVKGLSNISNSQPALFEAITIQIENSLE